MKKEDILELLRAEKGYVSGERISEMFDVSRTAVWKHINALKKEGYNIGSVSSRGYILKDCDVFNAAEILNYLETKELGRNIIFLPETDSTNNLAKRNSEKPNGTLFVAERQTAGRGRNGKEWISPAGGGLWMTLLLKPKLPPNTLSALTLVAGLAVTKALRKLTGGDIYIKWPNDIVFNRKKLCGILCEMSAEVGILNYVICGIGINVGNEKLPEAIENVACSIEAETGKKLLRSVVCAEVLNEFEKEYGRFMEGGIKAVIPEYKTYCITLDKEVVVIENDKKYHARAVDINENGGLVAETADGLRTLYSGEVSVRGLLGYV